MNKSQSRGSSRFFDYYDSPLKLVEVPGGKFTAWRLSDTGGWNRADDLINKVLLVGGDEIQEITRDDFVQLTERERAYRLKGTGPVFALYETVQAILDVPDRERRSLTPRERALVGGIRRKTFVMFEEELQRAGDPGADPTLAQG
ncbi:hypothetical protein [Micromonospora siamensis]|uniref:Uncharacterized protein n=1 Tax=Micromonospora siamensis TaxID=299152 RepID=A0A1C5HG28_9ACTN|nr:hypothetical protein [Micromonospora siamensis]SCG44807.1 hypothetical protein GA0074704_1643 [Micromonospora siamensis]